LLPQFPGKYVSPNLFIVGQDDRYEGLAIIIDPIDVLLISRGLLKAVSAAKQEGCVDAEKETKHDDGESPKHTDLAAPTLGYR